MGSLNFNFYGYFLLEGEFGRQFCLCPLQKGSELLPYGPDRETVCS